jgi:hypothetical protein
MSEPHPLGAHALSRVALEAVSPGFVEEGLKRARDRTLEVFAEIKAALREGMTEDEARRTGLAVFARHGVIKHWHKIYIRFGPGTVLSFHDPLQADYRLRPGDACYIDLGPVWPDPELGMEYEGDYGDSFVFTPPTPPGVQAPAHPEAEKIASHARMLFVEAREKWKSQGLSGKDLYAFLQERAEALGYRLAEKVEGHRMSDFPHHRHSKETLGRLPFPPTGSLWVLEVMLRHPSLPLGAFFEDLL